jgi:hypothetical protein
MLVKASKCGMLLSESASKTAPQQALYDPLASVLYA